MPITPFLGDQKFDPETKRIMGVAFEMARAAIGCPFGDSADRIIAKRIIELAKAGERNTELLSKLALETLRSPPNIQPSTDRTSLHDPKSF